jgi:hypothetical protein
MLASKLIKELQNIVSDVGDLNIKTFIERCQEEIMGTLLILDKDYFEFYIELISKPYYKDVE